MSQITEHGVTQQNKNLNYCHYQCTLGGWETKV